MPAEMDLRAVPGPRGGRTPVRPRRRRRQGRSDGAPGGAAGVRRPSTGRRDTVHRGRGGGRLADPGAEVLERHRDVLAADVYVIADSGNWDVGRPAFTTTLRGLVDCVVEVATLDHALHSGQYGGAVPDALTTLCRLLATLHDTDGNVAIEGLTAHARPGAGLSRTAATRRDRPAGRRAAARAGADRRAGCGPSRRPP